MRRVESIFSMAGVSYEVTMLNVERSTFSEAGLSCESAAGGGHAKRCYAAARRRDERVGRGRRGVGSSETARLGKLARLGRQRGLEAAVLAM